MSWSRLHSALNIFVLHKGPFANSHKAREAVRHKLVINWSEANTLLDTLYAIGYINKNTDGQIAITEKGLNWFVNSYDPEDYDVR